MTRYRALDIHTHYRTGERRQAGTGQNDAQKLFGSKLESEDPVAYFAARSMMAVAFDIDTETATGERMANDEVAELAGRSEGRIIGFASVDPWKGKAGIRELERARELGLVGVKLQPITQAFSLGDSRFRPLWSACESLGMPLIVHAGTTAIGAGSPGGRGLHLKYGRPMPDIDDVAADFPNLTIVAAHFGWPWHLELLAIARHKGNVYIDLSGWAPRYFPTEVLQYLNSVMPDKFLYGSDFPLMDPDRWLGEFEQLDLKDGVRERVLYANACQVLGLDTADFDLNAGRS